jgi:hypothetical protein
MKRTSGFRMFLAACIPGCGEMYQGYMKRGLSLMLVTAGIFALAVALGLGAPAIFLPVVWLYAFFDSYNLRRQLEEGTAPEDGYLLNFLDQDAQRFSVLWGKRHGLVGWVLVIIGLYTLYSTVVYYFGWFIPGWLSSFLYRGVPRLVLVAVLLGLGIWFIRGPRPRPEQDFASFVPPAEPVSGAGAAASDGETESAADDGEEAQ